ncbi:hypothetical protein QYF50_12870 [Paenibacillus vini]|uniref:hypothetical protein n=1 Tax=Paenibacillus vini TaxID=1476024 RepID=UPI0025B72D37|nr:hypothetical protein [Paenibacillus vini]MDN4068789.1 hypothetical protein [Paenibacillus vini]
MNYNYRAAFSQTDITPDFPVEMIGRSREKNKVNGIHYPLKAQIVLFEHQNDRYCLIAIDSLGFTTALSNELRERVAEALGTTATNVMLNFSHTHSAPDPLSPLNGQKYYSLLCDRVISCITNAIVNLQPCLVSWAVGETDIGENRRDGCSVVDKRLGALQIVNATTQKSIVMLLRVCAHANILMSHSNKLSSDYFGATREKIAEHYGCPIMMIQGAAGNIKPVGVDKIDGGTTSDVDRIADELLQSATKLRFTPKKITRLHMLETEIQMYSDVPEVDEARQIAEKSGLNATGWLSECEQLRNAGITTQTQNRSIHFLLLNEGSLCGVPDEIFCELSLAVTEQTDNPLLFFNGYTNGCTGYLPNREEWIKGGYETHDSYLIYYMYHGHVMPFRADTAKRLVRAVVDVWKKSN